MRTCGRFVAPVCCTTSSGAVLTSTTVLTRRFAAAAAAATAGRTGGINGESSDIDIKKFSALPATAIERLPKVDQVWMAIDGPHRARLEKFLQQGGKKAAASFNGATVLATRTEGIKAANNAAELPTSAAITPKLPAAVKAFIAAGKADAPTLFESYDKLSLLLKGIEREREVIQLDIWACNDVIQLGLKFFAADKLAQKKKELVVATKALAANRALMKQTCEASFSTAVMNDVLNICRILAAGGDREARELGVQILDDLSLFGVGFDAETELLFRNLNFGDMPHEDSGLLFELVEGSVGGDVSVRTIVPDPKNDKARLPALDAVADQALGVISQRFQTPLSPELAKLREVDTHPMLQRSEV